MPAASHVSLAVRLLRDAAGFFRNVGEQNPELKEEMFDNADVYDRVAQLLENDPDGLIELEED
ncbi:MAG: hypothetical protein HKN43_09535 [Rhodothermales bacterium]|nr:hypothetical protein [Rhodothermales bacterium]